MAIIFGILIILGLLAFVCFYAGVVFLLVLSTPEIIRDLIEDFKEKFKRRNKR